MNGKNAHVTYVKDLRGLEIIFEERGLVVRGWTLMEACIGPIVNNRLVYHSKSSLIISDFIVAPVIMKWEGKLPGRSRKYILS